MLYVSPQAVSKGVQVLECRMGVSLFERGPNGIALTSFGELFKEKAEEALLSLERLQVLADQYKKERTLSLTVGIHSLCFRENGGSIDRSALLEFQEAHQTADLSFAEMKGDAIVDSVAEGRVDLGISVVSKGDFRLSEGLLLKSSPLRLWCLIIVRASPQEASLRLRNWCKVNWSCFGGAGFQRILHRARAVRGELGERFSLAG